MTMSFLYENEMVMYASASIFSHRDRWVCVLKLSGVIVSHCDGWERSHGI